jgi:hypothetical protein
MVFAITDEPLGTAAAFQRLVYRSAVKMRLNRFIPGQAVCSAIIRLRSFIALVLTGFAAF